MNKAELVAAMAEKSGLTKKDAEAVLSAFLKTVETQLKYGDKIQLVGFGSFEIKERPERTGRNPGTNETVVIPAARIPVFHPGTAMKETVNGK